MAEPLRSRLRILLSWTLGFFAGGIVLVLVSAYSGIYRVAASAGHPDWRDWFFTLGRRRSVKVNSVTIDAPVLDLAGRGCTPFDRATGRNRGGIFREAVIGGTR